MEDKKKLYITSGNSSAWVDEDKFKENAKDFYEKFPDAQVMAFDDYNPEMSADVAPGTQFLVSTSTGDNAVVDYDKFVNNQTDFYKQFPDAKVSTIRNYGNDYWKGIAEQQKSALDKFDIDNGKFLSDYSNAENVWDMYKGSDSGFMTKPQKDALTFLGDNLQKYNALSDERRKLQSDYSNNPYVVSMYKSKAEEAGSLEAKYRAKSNELMPYAASGPVNSTIGYSGWTANMGYKGNAPFADKKESKFFNEASQLEQKIQQTYLISQDKGKGNNGFADYMSNFWAGHADTFSDADFWSRGLTTIARNLDIRDIMKSLEEKGLDVNKMSEKDFDDNLSEGQKALLSSFARLAVAQEERAKDMAPGYTSGKTSAESLGFMAEFLATAGIAKAAGSAVIKGTEEATASGLRSWLGRELAKGSGDAIYQSAIRSGVEKAAQKGGLKAASEATKLGIKAKAVAAKKAYDYVIRPVEGGVFHAVLQPSTYSTISDNLTQIDDNGKLISAGKAVWGGVLDQMIENWSEMMGGAVEDILSLPLKGAGAIGERVLGETTFGQWGKWLADSNAAKVLHQAGFNGMLGEMGEEWVGNAARVGLGLMSADEFTQFTSAHDQLEMAASFAPVALFGLGTTSYAAARQAKYYRQTADAMRGVLGRQNWSKEKIASIMDEKHTKKEIADALTPVIQEIIRGAKNGTTSLEDYKTTLNFARASAMESVLKTAQSIERENNRAVVRNRIEKTLGGEEGNDKGKFWTIGNYESEGGKQFELETVTEVQDASGARYYDMGESNGLIALKNQEDGSLKFVDASKYSSELESGELQAQSYKMGDYLDAKVDEEIKAQKQQEKKSLIAQRNAAVSNKCQPGMQITLGTEDTPLTGTVMQVTADGVILSFDHPVELNGETGQVHKVSMAQIANAVGVNVDTRTEDEKAADQADKDEISRKRIEVLNGTMKGKQFATGGQLYTFSHTFEEPYVDENGNEVVDVWAKDENGEEVELTVPTSDLKEQTLSQEEQKELEEKQDDASEAVAEESEGAPKDFRGGLLPMKLDAEGKKVVDADALWNNDPEAYLRWNDSQNGGDTEDSREMLSAVIAKREAEKQALKERKKAETVPSVRQNLQSQIANLDAQISMYGGFLAEYEEEARKAEDARQEAQNTEAEQNAVNSEQTEQETEQTEQETEQTEPTSAQKSETEGTEVSEGNATTEQETSAKEDNTPRPLRVDSARSAESEREESVSANSSLLDVIHTLYTKGKEYASKIFQRSFFDVVETPEFMKQYGLTGSKFTIRYGVITRHWGKDESHNLTEQEWSKLPEALRNPFAITKLKDEESGYRIYTSLQNAKGEYVVVGVDVKNAGRDIEVNAISTVFGRKTDAGLTTNEEVIYRSEKITPEQSSLLGQPNSDQYPTEQESSSASEDKQTSEENKTSFADEMFADTLSNAPEELKERITIRESSTGDEQEENFVQTYDIDGKPSGISRIELFDAKSNEDSTRFVIDGSDVDAASSEQDKWESLAREYRKTHPDVKLYISDESGIGFSTFKDAYEFRNWAETHQQETKSNTASNEDNKRPGKQWQKRIESQGEIKGKMPKITKPSLFKFVASKKEFSSTPGGVFHDEGFEVASTGRILIAVRSQYDAELEGKVTDKNGEVIADEYPKWRSIMPKNAEPLALDLNNLASFIQGAKSKENQIDPETDYVRQPSVSFLDNEGNVVTADLKELETFVNAALYHKCNVSIARTTLPVLYAENGDGSVKILLALRPKTMGGFLYDGRQQETSGTSEAKSAEKSHKAEGRISAVSQVSNEALGIKDPAQQLAFEAVSQMLSDAGIPVEQVSNETMRQMAEGAEKKGEALETVSSQNGDQQTVISSASGANVLKNLDILHDSLEITEKTEEKTFLGRLAMALGAKRQGSDSQYATFETMNGRIVTIRLANHNATVSTFDNRGEEDGISLVVSAKENGGIDNDGKTHLVEFYYDAIKLRKAEGKPLADIVSSIKQALYSGEYRDTTGLAQVEEVNAENIPEFMTVYHGSGAKFDKFDSAFMGTGEGEQAYGWGHYVTEVEEVGRTYADAKTSTLYTIEIPEDNGHNYLSYDKAVPKEEVKSVLDALYDHLVADEESGYSDKAASKELRKELDSLAEDEIDGNNLYGTVSSYLGTDKEASEFLGGIGYAGIKYPTNFKSGGNAEGTSNYVIFKDSDLKIVDRVEFLRDGAVVYGAAVRGKIYLNAERLNPNTPIHEYTHLWDKACKAKNPELWKRGVELMKQTSVWKEVENDPNYKGLDEDGIASEVHSRLTGNDGAALLERMSKEALESKGVLKAADKMTVIENLKKWLSDFWYWIKDTMTAWSRSEAEKVTIEDFINMPIADLAKGTRLRDEDRRARFQENAEMAGIVASAKADGTYMKAPNGKPSNLNERQWAQVRTKAFKKWFGDWEKSARIESLRVSEPVEITGDEYKGKYDLTRDSAKAWIKDNLRGEYTNKNTKERIEVRKDGAQKVTSHSMGNEAHLKSLVAIPELIEKSIFIEERPNEKDNLKYDSYRYYVCGLKIGETNYTVKITVGVKGGSKYYDHALTEIEKGSLLDNIDALSTTFDAKETSKGFGSTPGINPTTLAISKDSKLLSILQNNSSKVVDENGEPKVVYHYTGNSFTEFGKGKEIGENTFGNAADAGYAMTTTIGHWFTSNNNQPEYMGKPMELFLDIKAPYTGGSLESLARELGDSLSAEDINAYDEDWHNVEPLIRGGEEWQNSREREGYDGAVIDDEEFKGTSYIAFSSNQIKSATDNVGTFDTENDDIRFQFVGEQGAENADRAEEVTTRLDNLSVAREMEEQKKDAKSIKMATGWERGADGKWRYEIPDAKVKDTIEIGGRSEKRFEEDMLWTDGKLGDSVDAPELFKAYPQLKDITIHTDAVTNDMPSNGEYDSNTKAITIHATELKYLNSILNHEIQHAIQNIEGFARGGSSEQMARAFNAAKNEWKARAYAQMLSETSKELGGEENRSELESAVAKEYEEAGISELLPDESTRALGYNYFARGYADKSMDDAIKRFGLEESTRADYNPFLEYKRLAGEVEARNVQSRMDLTDAERRNTLAIDTEDVSREDQIFLYGNGVSESRTVFGGNSGYVGYSMSRRAAQAREDGKFPKTDFKKEYKVKEDSLKALVDAKVIDDSEWHHTSMYGNRTTFYQWDEPEYADIYAENKKEIDAMVADKEKDLKSKIANLQEQLDAMPKERPYRYEMESDEFRNAKRRIERETSAKTQEINDSYDTYQESREQHKERMSRLEAAWAEREARIKELEENASESDKVIIAHNKANEEYDQKRHSLEREIEDARKNNNPDFNKKLSDYFVSRYEAIEAQRKAEAEAKAKLDAVNEQFNEELQRYDKGEMDTNEMLHIGKPQGVMRLFLPDLPIVMRQRILTKASVGKHNVGIMSLADMPSYLSAPIFVFQRSDNALGVLTEMKDRDGKNVCVAIELDRQVQNGGEILEVNDIRSIHGRNVADIVYPIVQNETLRWVNKEKGLAYLSSASRYVQQEIDSQDLSSATKVVESFENPTVVEKNIADEDNTIQYSIVDEGMPDSGSSEATEILDDVKSNGLTARMSEEQSDDLLLDLYQDVSESTRRKVTNRAMKNGFSFPKAMAGYIADMDTDNLSNEDKACLTKARDAIKKGLLIDTGNTNSGLSLKDTQWIMYQTAHAGERGIFAEADRIENAERLGHTEADEAEKRQLDNGVIVDRADERISDDAAGMYNKSVSYWLNRLKEGFVDQFEAVNALVEAIEKATGTKVNTFEDIRLALNQQSSKGFSRMNAYMRDFYGPLLDTIRDLVKNGRVSYEEIVRYVMLKHAIERNHVFAMRDAKEHYKSKHDAEVKELRQARAKAEKELAEATAAGDQKLIDERQYALDKIDERINNADAALVEAEKRIEEGTDSVYLEFRENDYGGLTSMFSEYPGLESRDKYKTDAEYNAAARAVRKPKYDNVADMEAAAAEEVERFESNPDADTDELWQRINAATKETLRSQYMSGMLSKEQYEAVSGMFEYYVPLRGFSDTTGEDIWDYYTAPKTGGFAPAIIGAKGRKTEADNPFNWIGTMASSAIAGNVKNESKLALYYLVLNRPEQNLVMTGESWYKFDAEATAKYRAEHPDSNKRVFVPAVPPSMEGMDSETAMQTYNAWQASMRELEKKGEAINEKNRLDASKDVAFIDDRQESEHVIRLKIGGVEHSLIINGSPRAAQAINGLLNMETSSFQQHFGWVLRGMSALNTSLNPEFWISNLQRDLLFAMMSMDVNGNKTSSFVKNLVNPFKLERMAKAYEEGTLGDSEIEKYYREFCDNGAVTGFTVVNNNDYWEREIKRHIEPTQYEKLKGAVEPMTAYFMRLGEAVEQMTRFSAYLNARQNGNGVTEAVSAAKEISVNFNRKGSGMHITWEEAEKLTTKDGKPLNTMQKAAVCALSLIPEYGRHAIMFFNAAVQGLNAMYRLIKKNPKRMAGWLAGYYTIGVLQALLHALADDDDDYLDIPDYTRRNNLLLGYKGAYLKWALPQESRVFYALGDLTVNKFMGREPHKNTFSEVLNMCTDVLPLGGGEGVAAIAPSTMQPIMDIALNKDFTGQRVYNDLRFLSEGAKERTPRYNNALAYTNGFAILISKGLNDVSGGTPYDAGEINIPPEILQHLFEGYGGGSLTTINKTFDTAENLFKAALGEKNEVSVRRFPFLNRVLLLNDERTRDSYVTELFDYYKDEAEHVKTKEKQMIKFNDQDGLEALKKSYDYRLYQLYEKNYRKKIASYTKEIKLEPDVQERKKLIREQEELKKQFLGEISTLDKR